MVSIKRESSQEGNLVPYMIQPMEEVPKKVKRKKVKIGEKSAVSTVHTCIVLSELLVT